MAQMHSQSIKISEIPPAALIKLLCIARKFSHYYAVGRITINAKL